MFVFFESFFFYSVKSPVLRWNTIFFLPSSVIPKFADKLSPPSLSDLSGPVFIKTHLGKNQKKEKKRRQKKKKQIPIIIPGLHGNPKSGPQATCCGELQGWSRRSAGFVGQASTSAGRDRGGRFQSCCVYMRVRVSV